ncbi:Ig-like domain-containing protein [Rhodosalinus sp. 5P4]|uniref:Ig-like domain-containing protein n=1 Tax=Rhodosalinus sp. 5P4 TaxID=3239196 RepID=UPI0035261D96
MALIILAGLLAVMIAAPDARAQANVLDLSNVDVDGGSSTVRTITLPAGTSVDSIAFDFSVRHFGISYGSETRIRITAPNGTTVLYRGDSDFGFASSPGTYSFSGTLPFSSGAPAGGTWTITLDDSFNDSVNPDHTYQAGSEISFLGGATDTTPPSVILSGGPASLTGTDPFTVTATFDEDVTGFDDLANDVIVTNGSVTGITGGPAVYTLEITPSGNGNVSITVPAGAAQDAANNDNTASNALRIDNRIVEITREQIAGFMLGRANNLASNQPGLTRFLQDDGCGNFNANTREGSASLNGCVSQGNTWAEITGAWSKDDSYVVGSFGMHGFVNPNLLAGGMLQVDHAEDSAGNSSGTGWMVGPYFVAKTPDQPLYFEGRLLYGQTDGDISPIGTYTDSFETERWLAQLRATGEYEYQNSTLMPLLDFTYTDDTQRAYTDSLGNTIPGQTVSLMQVKAGLDFSTPLPVRANAVELTGGVSGIYSSTDGGAAAPEFENWRGRTHLGLNWDSGQGATVRAGMFYDGIGSNFRSVGGNLGVDIRF